MRELGHFSPCVRKLGFLHIKENYGVPTSPVYLSSCRRHLCQTLRFNQGDPEWHNVASHILVGICSGDDWSFAHQPLVWISDHQWDALVRILLSFYPLSELISQKVNTLWPGDVYMRQWVGSSLVHVKACLAFSASSHYPNQWWIFCQWDTQSHTTKNFDGNSNSFIRENAYEIIVCKIWFILFRSQLC